MLPFGREFVHTGIAAAIRHEYFAARRKRGGGRRLNGAPPCVTFSCSRAETVFRQAGIRALAFDADGLQQPAIGGELHGLLMILVGGPDAPQQAKGSPTGISL